MNNGWIKKNEKSQEMFQRVYAGPPRNMAAFYDVMHF